MALIRCSECGKEFSDKAAACPNCGCPTAEAKQGAAQTPAKNEQAARKMLEAVEQTLEKARKAGARFELSSDEVQKLNRATTIDLNGNSAMTDTKIIVSAALTACEGLYRAYQKLIPELDRACRPLVTENPGGIAVRAVYGTIKWLNDESEIENNYGVNFNSVSLGNVVQAKFIPSDENRRIQAFWESEYMRAPDHMEAEPFWQQKLSEHRKLARETERQARVDAREAEREMRRHEREAREAEKQKAAREEEARAAAYADRLADVEAEYKKRRRAGDRFACRGMKYAYLDAAGNAVCKGTASAFNGLPGTDICQIAVTYEGVFGLKRDGTVCMAGIYPPDLSRYGLQQCQSWRGVKRISAGLHVIVALFEDGTCAATRYGSDVGRSYQGEGDVGGWRNVVDVCCCNDFTAGLKADGTVCATGSYDFSGWRDVMMLFSCRNSLFGVTREGKLLTGYSRTHVSAAKDVVAVGLYGDELAVLQSDGTVLGTKKQWDEKSAATICTDAVWIWSPDGNALLVLRKNGTVEELQPGVSMPFLFDRPKIFDSYDAFNTREEQRERAAAEAAKKAREKLEQQKQWQAQGLCRYCGGAFEKKLLGMKCGKCGKRKDY